MTAHRRFRWLQWGLLMSGLLLLGLWARAELRAHAYQEAESLKLDATLRAVSTAAPGSRGHVLGRLEIPRLRIRAIVAEGVDSKTLARAVGHVGTTAWPGKPGNCALAGHRDTFLRGLGNIRVNDVIRIVTSDRTYLYQVDWTEVVGPRRIDVLEPTPERSVTLITCYPFRYVGHAPKRFIVRARQVDAFAEVLPDPQTD